MNRGRFFALTYGLKKVNTGQLANVGGYPSLQYMYAVFKKRFNLTPKKFREKNMKNELVS
jgi:LacI family transcriptional regulator